MKGNSWVLRGVKQGKHIAYLHSRRDPPQVIEDETVMLVKNAGLRHEGLRHECPAVALAKDEQRELLEAVREVRALMVEGEEEAGSPVRDMQERIAVMFAA